MSGVSSWLLSIAGVILLSVLAELILPEGQMNKYTKVIFSFVVLLVIILPLPKLFGKDFNLEKFFNYGENTLQEDYLYQINLDKLTSLNEDIAEELEVSGLKNVVVSINANILAEKLEIFDVFVDLCDLEYSENFESKNITQAKQTVVQIIKKHQLLEAVEVKFSE